MVTGTLVMESLRPGCVLDASGLVFTTFSRLDIDGATGHQPPRWTLAEFVVDAADPGEVAGRFADVLDMPGWYVDFRGDDTVWVVFAGRVFTYARGDAEGRQAAVDYALTVGVPLSQADWPE